MIRTILTSTLAAGALSAGALAQDGSAYVGGGYSLLNGGGATYDTLTLRGGVDLMPEFAIEGEVLFGLGSSSYHGGTSELNWGGGVFARGNLPVAEGVTLFGRAGFAVLDTDFTIGGVSGSSTDTDWAAGAGGEFSFDRNNAFRIEYTRYNSNGGYDGYSASYVLRF
ncbi:MAG: outer membrane beta-barrel protein [Maricaulaceae bacterium]|nr:outer membrane beta-barrel protein [Maricaulaceae bacterium]